MRTTNAKHTPGSITLEKVQHGTRTVSVVRWVIVNSRGEEAAFCQTEAAAKSIIAPPAARIADLERTLAAVTAQRDHALDAMAGAAELLDPKDGTPRHNVITAARERILAALRACENGGAL